MSTLASGLDLASALQSSGSTAAAASTSSAGLGNLDNDDFMRIILQELTQQDPFEPNDTQQLVEQVSSLRNIESQQSLQSTLENLTLQSSVNQASSMLGKRVEVLGGDGTAASGIVERVSIVDGAAQLRLDGGQTVPLDRVTSISNDTSTP